MKNSTQTQAGRPPWPDFIYYSRLAIIALLCLLLWENVFWLILSDPIMLLQRAVGTRYISTTE